MSELDTIATRKTAEADRHGWRMGRSNWERQPRCVAIAIALSLAACGGRSGERGLDGDDSPGTNGTLGLGGAGIPSSAVGGATNTGFGGSAAGGNGAGGPAVVLELGSVGGAMPVSVGSVPCSSLIDDMEDGDAWIPTIEGRSGAWYLYEGMSSAGEGPPGVRVNAELLPSVEHSSHYAMHAVSEVSENGSLLGVDLAFTGETYGRYDASTYAAIRFWGMGSPAGTRDINVVMSTTSGTWAGYGGVLSSVESSSPQHLGTILLDDSWRQFELSLESVEELDQVINIQFIGELAPPGFWIDDLEFRLSPCAEAR